MRNGRAATFVHRPYSNLMASESCKTFVFKKKKKKTEDIDKALNLVPCDVREILCVTEMHGGSRDASPKFNGDMLRSVS